MDQSYGFPRTTRIDVWEHYLGRPLVFKEKVLMENFKAEKIMNDLMRQLYIHCKNKGRFYVPILTELDGNCLFESLAYHKLGKDIENLRKILSVMMYIYKDYKYFLPNIDTTLNDMFSLTNEVEYVVSREKKGDSYEINFLKYDYNIMCQDIANSSSWCRLPTQMILMIISYIFKVEIIILSSQTGYEHIINAFENSTEKPELKKVYLGHLGEAHYVPLDILEDDEELDPIYYTCAKEELIKWAIKMEELKNNQPKEEEFKEMELGKESNYNQVAVSFQENNDQVPEGCQENNEHQ